MAAINVRNLPDHVHRGLRVRAARSGRSMEAEARAILTEACAGESPEAAGSDVQEWVSGLYGKKRPRRVVDSFIADRRRDARRE